MQPHKWVPKTDTRVMSQGITLIIDNSLLELKSRTAGIMTLSFPLSAANNSEQMSLTRSIVNSYALNFLAP